MTAYNHYTPEVLKSVPEAVREAAQQRQETIWNGLLLLQAAIGDLGIDRRVEAGRTAVIKEVERVQPTVSVEPEVKDAAAEVVDLTVFKQRVAEAFNDQEIA